jgi:Rieske Fe-S protein
MASRETIDRRNLLSWLIGGVSAAIAGTVALIFGRFLAGSASAQELGGATAVSLGKLSDWGKGPVERTVSFLDRDGYYRENRRARIFLTRIGVEPVVLSATCTHLGCAVSWDPGSLTFRCPCHGGVYRSDGTVAAGPPPRPLRRLPIQIRDGELFVSAGDLA